VAGITPKSWAWMGLFPTSCTDVSDDHSQP
jgi:hypothetical protein